MTEKLDIHEAPELADMISKGVLKSMLLSGNKIPYSNDGITLIKTWIEENKEEIAEAAHEWGKRNFPIK